MSIKNNLNKYHITYDDIIHDFDIHLALNNNLRIFFSAKFGTGKSYFLRDFFEENRNYEAINVYPIKYSTASNIDVFELIKFDIFYHLIKHHEDVFEKNVSLSAFMEFQWFIKSKLDKLDLELSVGLYSDLTDNEVFKSFGFDLAISKTILNIYQKVKKSYEEFKINQKNDELNTVKNYITKILKKMPEFGDIDPLTCIIKEAIILIREKTKKQIVLLIDDMDRLDPDHLFRILNIFGNHLQSSSNNQIYINENRFGFDKVIFVGDIANIKSIFHHKYGPDTDFEGYSSKYYSKAIYHFTSSYLILYSISVFLQDVQFPQTDQKIFENIKSDNEDLISTIFKNLIKSSSLTFRRVHQKRNYNFTDNTKFDIVYKPLNYNDNNELIYKVYNFFLRLYGDKHNLILAINSIEDFDIYALVTIQQAYNCQELFFGLLNNIEYIYTNGKKEIFRPKQNGNEHRVKLKSLGDEYYYLHYSKKKPWAVQKITNTETNDDENIPDPKISFKFMFINFIESCTA